MLRSFLSNWHDKFRIVVYTENVEINKEFYSNPRIVIRDLNEVQDLLAFKKRHENNPKAHGFINDSSTKEFQFDAVRFSHKVFALYDCFQQPPGLIKSMAWIDADTFTFNRVPENFIDQVAPRNYWTENDGKKRYGICYLGRIKQHSECGFVSYNCTHPLMKEFWETFAGMYKTDQLFELPEWHDSFVFDHVRKIFESKGMVNFNITPDIMSGHPFINCNLGLYMDHMKGARKINGRSRKTERTVKTNNEPRWWK